MIILHAYSTNNSGDGLLVELTKELSAEAGLGSSFKLVALDKESFPAEYDIYEPKIIKASALGKIKQSITICLGFVLGNNELNGAIKYSQGEVIVAVGGGNLRAGTVIESIKTLLAQCPQLDWASRKTSSPTIYFSQSIGPLRGPVGWLLKKKLKNIDLICARDDRTIAELGLPNVMRVPDLAVQELALELRKDKVRQNNFEKVFLIARDVNVKGREKYITRLKELKKLLPNVEPLLQSTGRGNNDEKFYQDLGWGNSFRSVKEALATDKGIVISVRLHGSLQSMISGCPSIHLSYERKGFGAFEDLGIVEYCHGFKKFQPNLVVSQVEKLKLDSSDYWQSASNSVESILKRREVLKAEIEKLVKDKSK